MNEKQYYVYILSNYLQTVLYVGVTNDLVRRVHEHKQGVVKGFTSRYQVNRLVYYDICGDPYYAITREKQIKAGSRKKKNEMITAKNPKWEDLFESIKV